jgi:DNA-binding transcriptional LysR family regulator
MLNKLEMLRIFCVAAESANFKEAAVRLGISPQAVGRAVKELEENLGEILFFRNTRNSQITEQGIALAHKARINLTEIDELFQKNSSSESTKIKGLVRIATPTIFSRYHLGPLLSRLLILHPELEIQVILSDEVSDVVNEKIDIGIRVGFMRDSQLIAKTVSKMHFNIVATPELIQRFGKPKSIDELSNMPVVAAIDPKTGKPWPWFLANGFQWYPKQAALACSDAAFEFEAVINGCGFGQISSFLAIPYLQSGKLIQILPELTPQPWNVYVYRTHKNPVPARVRAVYDWLSEELANQEFFPSEYIYFGTTNHL